jgi:DNA-binding MarR family transcriptional regulator
VKRIPDPKDGRGLLVELSSKGLALVDQIAPEHLANERGLLSALSAEDQQQLIRLLRKLLLSFEAASAAPPSSGRGGRQKVSRAAPRNSDNS